MKKSLLWIPIDRAGVIRDERGMSSQYKVVHITQLSDLGEDWVSHAAFSSGALGISESLAFNQPEGEEDVFTAHGGPHTVEIYFPLEGMLIARFLEELKLRFPEAQAVVKTEEDRDWLEEWKKGFLPFALVEGHWVVPSWCETPPEAQHKIWIDPGMAFGTGTHETTQLVAKFLKELVSDFRARSLLDVGTGTGILAILSRQLGISKVDATEIEPEARRVARENFTLNESEIGLGEKQVEDLSEMYDIVLANIIDGVLVRIQDALKARVRSGGWLVLSGIILEREKTFLEGFRLPQGKVWDHRLVQGDWVLYAVKL